MRDSWVLPYERVAEVCAEWPDRFRGLAGIDPTTGMRGLRELERGVRDFGFVGAHIYHTGLNWPRMSHVTTRFIQMLRAQHTRDDAGGSLLEVRA